MARFARGLGAFGWALLVVAIVTSVLAWALVEEARAAEACMNSGLLVLCTGGPPRLLVLIMAVLAVGSWALFGVVAQHALRRPR